MTDARMDMMQAMMENTLAMGYSRHVQPSR
jgi:hypothetical protein